MKRGAKLGMAALALALLVPEGAQRGSLGLAAGAALTLALLALAVWLLWSAGVLPGSEEKDARACARGSDAVAAHKASRKELS